ncbi:hypothetical protein QA584_08395 [Anaerocolumna sp. AGMB13025]|uniref:hypothetical protein n=1 Tax=Anaerocolumna sp. AGMB13025 TaxID=3039116 RepID=UPI00241E92C2|nr:hypothetical protein [Anaerocolumna sp. AGMB13025]WFR59091.1 hypothetical protein QA584_08395 [Anaerocolumna sp. AGMB13025]
MSDLHCEYNGSIYKIKKRNGGFIITSHIKEDGFTNYIDVLGKEHIDFFMKSVNIDEVDVIYKEDVFIKYQEEYFQLFADKIFKNDVLNNSYMVWTNSEQLAHDYVFEKKEQFVFIKYITREEIEAVKIVKKPTIDFKDIQPSEKILEGDALDNWLSEIS